MNVTLLRHGETVENAAGIIQGQRGGRLSKRGKSQSLDVALMLADQSFDKVYCSDLMRCVETASYVMKFHSGVEIEYAPELREMNYGEYEGLPIGDVDWDALEGGILTRKAPGGENGEEVRTRVLQFMDFLLKNNERDNLLLVTHGGPMRVVKSRVEEIELEKLLNIKIPNCTIWDFTINNELS